MWQKIKDNWKAILSVLGSILGLILFRQWNRKDLLADANTAKTDLKDAVLNEQKKEVQKDQAEVQKTTEALKSDLNKPVEDLSPSDVEAFWASKK